MSIIKVTVLGCGSSGGVPRIDGDFGACDPANPKNHRLRCCLLVQRFLSYDNLDKVTTVLIDTSPDLRVQILRAKVKKIDALLYTHDHADQTHGIDDLRALSVLNRQRIKAYMDTPTRLSLMPRFEYIFQGHEKNNYPSILESLEMPPIGENLKIDGEGGAIDFKILSQVHGNIPSLGFRFNDIAYCNDTNFLPDETIQNLYGLKLFIVDALRYKPHPSHANLEIALDWINKIKPEKSILTNMHIDMDYETLQRTLPENIEPAYDGMVFEIIN